MLFALFDKIRFVFNANVTMCRAKLGYALASAKSCARSGFNWTVLFNVLLMVIWHGFRVYKALNIESIVAFYW